MNTSESLHDLSERVQTDMAIALERACATLPAELDTYATRKHVAQRLIVFAESGEVRLSELTAAAMQALTELTPADAG